MKTPYTTITINLYGPKKARQAFASIIRGFINTCVGFVMPATVDMSLEQTETKS